MQKQIIYSGCGNIALSFNGGKDSLVVLSLTLDALRELNMTPSDIIVFTIITPDSFDEMIDFVLKAEER